MDTNLPKRSTLHGMPVWCRRVLLYAATFMLSAGGVHWYQRHQINAIYDQWRAQGLPTNPEELTKFYRPPVGGTDNSALWLPAIENASQVDFMAWYSADEDEDETQINLLLDEVPPAAGQTWDHQEVVEEFLMDVTPELQALYHAAEAGGQATSPAESPNRILLKFPQDARTAARLPQLESQTALYHRDATRCLQAIRALLALFNVNEGSPDTIGAMSFCAISSMGHVEVIDLLKEGIAEDQHLAEIQKLVCQVDYLEVCRMCRADVFISCVDSINEVSRFPFDTANELDILRRLELSRPAYTKPWPEMLSDLSSFSERMQALKTSRWQNSIRFQTSKPEAVFDSLQFINRFAIVMAYNSSRQSSLNALLAAERHRLRHGSYPVTISAIDADLIGKGRDGSSSLLDPFTGKPLCYLLTDTELSIYSVGENRLDDGGHFEPVPEKGLIDIGYSVKRK